MFNKLSKVCLRFINLWLKWRNFAKSGRTSGHHLNTDENHDFFRRDSTFDARSSSNAAATSSADDSGSNYSDDNISPTATNHYSSADHCSNTTTTTPTAITTATSAAAAADTSHHHCYLQLPADSNLPALLPDTSGTTSPTPNHLLLPSDYIPYHASSAGPSTPSTTSTWLPHGLP